MQTSIETIDASIAATNEQVRVLSRTRSNSASLVETIMKEIKKVSFVMSEYWKGKSDLPDRKALQEAIVEDSFGIDYSGDGSLVDRAGFISAVRWDDEEECVMVDGLDAVDDAEGNMDDFSVPLERVENVEEVLLFIRTFASE